MMAAKLKTAGFKLPRKARKSKGGAVMTKWFDLASDALIIIGVIAVVWIIFR